MRRLIEWIYAAWFGIRIKTADQHIADIEQLLTQALDEQKHLNIEITQLTQALLDAMARRDALPLRTFPVGETEAIDWASIDQFPDPAPRLD